MKSFYISCAVALASFVLLCQARTFQADILDPPVQDDRTIRIRREEVKIESLNETLDLILREVRYAMRARNMDPFDAGNQTQSLYLATLRMQNIKVFNLSTIIRDGDIVMLDNQPGKKLTTQVKLTFDDLMVTADYKSSAFLIASMGQVRVKIPELTVEFIIEEDFGQVKLTLLEFNIRKNDESMQIRFSGNIESIIMNMVTRIVMMIVGNLLLSIIQGPVKSQLDNVINIVNKLMQETLTTIG